MNEELDKKLEQEEEVTPTPKEEETPFEDEKGDEVTAPEIPDTFGEAQPEGEGDAVTPPAPEEESPVRTFTQEQVNRLVGEARSQGREKGFEQGYAKAKSELLERYGLEGDDDMDALFRDGSRYGELNDRFADSGNQLKEAKTELALVKSGILPERFGDVKAIIMANGLDVSEESIASLLPTHPEWTAKPDAGAVAPAPDAQQKMIPQPTPEDEGDSSKMGVNPAPEADQGEGVSEKDKVMKNLFKL